ncbi:MAG: O-acetyl-ADP-ribose deacetylase [Terriglobales bacterium]
MPQQPIHLKIGADRTLVLLQGDITRESTDAIVNAANSSLLGGGGVDGAIHRNGGPAILEECKKIRQTQYPNGLPTGKAVATTAGKLPARYVIHTVGPIWHGGAHDEPNLLASCYREATHLADQMKLSSIAFPAISTGAYGYPLDEATEIAVSTVVDVLKTTVTVKEVRFVVFDFLAFESYAGKLHPLTTKNDRE